MLAMLNHCLYSLKQQFWANEGRIEEAMDMVETEGQKFCLLRVPRSAAAHGRQLKILIEHLVT